MTQTPPTVTNAPPSTATSDKRALLRRLWRITRWTLAVVLLLMTVGSLIAYAVESSRRGQDAEDFLAPGELIDIGSHRLHLWCEGTGSPLVVLDSGAAVFSTSWRRILPELAETTRVCAFDRSGLGWSELGPEPFDGHQAADELRALLAAAGEELPFVYVGHSLGGMFGRIYYDRYPDDLAGLVLLEPGDPEILLRDIGESRGAPVERDAPVRPCGLLCPVSALAARLGAVRWAMDDIEALADPLHQSLSVAEWKARTTRPENVRFLVWRGRFLTTIIFQTLDNTALGDLPTMVIYGSESGRLLGDWEDEEELREWQQESVVGWEQTVALSSRALGLREVAGANHVTLITYAEHAAKVGAAVVEMVEVVRTQPGPTGSS